MVQGATNVREPIFHLNRETMIKTAAQVPLRTMIVDDELAARDLLKFLLSQRPDIDVIGVYGTSRAAIAGIRRGKPDLVFLDVQMPRRDGFTLLDELGPDAPPVIFVTAFDEYAIKAFDIGAFDYVLKPVDEIVPGFGSCDSSNQRRGIGRCTSEWNDTARPGFKGFSRVLHPLFARPSERENGSSKSRGCYVV
jgi:CheY-like chemotaxis protein